MRLRSLLVPILLLISLLPLTSFAGTVPGEILVKFKSGREIELDKAVKSRGMITRKSIKTIRYKVIKIPENMTVEEAAEKFRKHPAVEYAGPNHTIHLAEAPQRFPTDPVFFYGDELIGMPQWGLYNDGINNDMGGKYRADIHAPEAWHITTGSQNVIIANIDTGVDYTHEDLWDKVLPGYNTIDGSNDAMDDHGHGTFTAGVSAASSDNDTGIAGISWNSPILPVKVLDGTGYGTEADGAEGVIWAVDHGAKVLNMSFATDIDEPALRDAINYAWQHGCLPVCASGNENVGINMYPAAYDHAIAVGASNEFDQRCTAADWGEGGSNYGSYLDVVAPGSYIVSTWTDPFWGQTYWPNSGTSAAAPFVSGVAALIWSVHPDWTPQQVFNQIVHTCDDIAPAGWDQFTGMGRINAYRALTETMSVTASIGLLSGIPDAKYVQLHGKVINTGSAQIPNMVYISEPDRSAGIMVYYTGTVPSGLAPGDRVDVSGTLIRVNEERALGSASITRVSSGSQLRSLGTTNAQAGGPHNSLLIGKLVRIWGTVTGRSWNDVYVDDGSNLEDGSGLTGIRVQMRTLTKPANGKIVSITGILGMDIPSGAPYPVPVIRVRDQNDIKVLK